MFGLIFDCSVLCLPLSGLYLWSHPCCWWCFCDWGRGALWWWTVFLHGCQRLWKCIKRCCNTQYESMSVFVYWKKKQHETKVDFIFTYDHASNAQFQYLFFPLPSSLPSSLPSWLTAEPSLPHYLSVSSGPTSVLFSLKTLPISGGTPITSFILQWRRSAAEQWKEIVVPVSGKLFAPHGGFAVVHHASQEKISQWIVSALNYFNHDLYSAINT